MTSKFTTRTFSPAEQQSSLKKDNINYAGVGETGVPEGKDLGTHLNEIADPNWVDPSLNRAVGNDKMDKDAFFKLMLAQIKYQDPTSPMKSDQMAAQLAQFTSLEQLQNLNTKMDDLTKAQAPAVQFQALNFIGKSVATDTSKVVRTVGDKAHDLKFQLLNDAQNVTINIKDETGETVRSYDLKNQKKGEVKLTWNGLDKNNQSARAGEFYFEVQALNAAGAKVAAQTQVKGTVTGVNYAADGVVLMVGNQTVKLQDVQRIEDANPKLALPQAAESEENKNIEGAKPKIRSNMDQIAMSAGSTGELPKSAK